MVGSVCPGLWASCAWRETCLRLSGRGLELAHAAEWPYGSRGLARTQTKGLPCFHTRGPGAPVLAGGRNTSGKSCLQGQGSRCGWSLGVLLSHWRETKAREGAEPGVLGGS